jgi:hypothetical protein
MIGMTGLRANLPAKQQVCVANTPAGTVQQLGVSVLASRIDENPFHSTLILGPGGTQLSEIFSIIPNPGCPDDTNLRGFQLFSKVTSIEVRGVHRGHT